MKPGDLVQLSCKAGYGYAYYPLLKENPRGHPPITVPDGTVLMYISRDEAWSDIKMQPMVHVILQDTLLSIDERFLAPVPPAAGMV